MIEVSSYWAKWQSDKRHKVNVWMCTDMTQIRTLILHSHSPPPSFSTSFPFFHKALLIWTFWVNCSQDMVATMAFSFTYSKVGQILSQWKTDRQKQTKNERKHMGAQDTNCAGQRHRQCFWFLLKVGYLIVWHEIKEMAAVLQWICYPKHALTSRDQHLWNTQ